MLACSLAAAQPAAPRPVEYRVSFARRAEHILHVAIAVPGSPAQRDFQLPVWNATYQVRDFSQYVTRVRATAPGGKPVALHKIDKTTWRITAPPEGATLEYDIIANLPGPFGAQVNTQHAFLNFAMVLMYAVDARAAPITVWFTDAAPNWKMATSLPSLSVASQSTNVSSSDQTGPRPPARSSAGEQGYVLHARNYDHLVDSPTEFGAFHEASFQEGGATYRVVIDADPADYNIDLITQTLRKIVASATWWMGDRPYEQYVFLYHFPRGPAGGGMEHAYSTAIDISAGRVAEGLAGVSAHEFFHLWNVKRIRPQSLEPVDYTRENFTTALWISEGMTSTVGEYIRLHAGLIDQKQYLQGVARGIRTLQSKPAHLFQSAEESSLDTWFDKYPQYGRGERSISYYNKGELLGVLLDLELRERSHGAKSLRDLFHWLNDTYARQGKFFPDSDGARLGAEALTGADFRPFFSSYVRGLEELPYQRLFDTVGLQLERKLTTVSDPGFAMSRDPQNGVTVVSVDDESPAARAGLQEGDVITAMNDKPVGRDFRADLAKLDPGTTVRLTLRNPAGPRDITFSLGRKEDANYELRDAPQITPAQRARRAAWLAQEDETATAMPKPVQ